MKKIFAMLLALAMVLSLAACGGSSAPAATEAPATEAPRPKLLLPRLPLPLAPSTPKSP